MAAAVCLAPDGQAFEQDCRLCRIPENRQRWGCDAEATEAVARIAPCPFCRGGEPGCPECNGEDEVPIFRCPRRLVTQREIDTVSAAMLVERSVLPDAGGWMDQPATFVQAYPLLTREIAHWQAVHHKIEAQKAKAAAGRR